VYVWILLSRYRAHSVSSAISNLHGSNGSGGRQEEGVEGRIPPHSPAAGTLRAPTRRRRRRRHCKAGKVYHAMRAALRAVYR